MQRETSVAYNMFIGTPGKDRVNKDGQLIMF